MTAQEHREAWLENKTESEKDDIKVEKGTHDQIPWQRCLGWGVGAGTEQLLNGIQVAFAMIYYNQVCGLSGSLIGVAQLIAQTVDAFLDPLIGHYSDTFHSSRWGRRHGFLYFSSIPLGLFLFLFLQVPLHGNKDSAFTFFWLLFTLMGARISLSFYLCPYLALGAELGPSYTERVRVMKYNVFWAYILGPAGVGLSFLLFMSNKGRLISEIDGKKIWQYESGLNNPDNYLPTAFLFGILTTVAGITAGLATHIYIKTLPQPEKAAKVPMVEYVRIKYQKIREAFRVRSLRILFGAAFFNFVSWGVVETLTTFFGTYYWMVTTEKQAFFPISWPVSGVIVFIIMSRVVHRFDKKNVVLFALGGFYLAVLTPFFLKMTGM